MLFAVPVILSTILIAGDRLPVPERVLDSFGRLSRRTGTPLQEAWLLSASTAETLVKRLLMFIRQEVDGGMQIQPESGCICWVRDDPLLLRNFPFVLVFRSNSDIIAPSKPHHCTIVAPLWPHCAVLFNSSNCALTIGTRTIMTRTITTTPLLPFWI